MIENQKYCVVLTTVANSQQAEQLATLIIEHRLAACVNIFPAVQSVYRWQNQVVQSEEVLLCIKTASPCYPELESMIKQSHAYELPEIIAIPLLTGSNDYLSWLQASIAQAGSA